MSVRVRLYIDLGQGEEVELTQQVIEYTLAEQPAVGATLALDNVVSDARRWLGVRMGKDK